MLSCARTAVRCAALRRAVQGRQSVEGWRGRQGLGVGG